VVGIIIIFFVFLNTERILANVNSGENLSKWYENTFQKTKKDTLAATTKEISFYLEQVNSYLLELKADSNNSINNIYATVLDTTKTNIEEYKVNYEQQLQSTFIKLKGNNFDGYIEEVKKEEKTKKDVEDVLNKLLES
jgi:hypothetical protein